MKKGFTLIELLGVIVILGILVLIAFPPLLNQIKKSKNEINSATKLIIIDAAKDYVDANNNDYERTNGNIYCINISTLIDNNYLNEKIKNENLDNIDTSKKVKLMYKNNNFEYEITNECEEEHNTVITNKLITQEIDNIKSKVNTTVPDGIYYYNGYGNLERDADIIYTNSDETFRGNILIHNHQFISGCLNYGSENYDIYKTTVTQQDYPCSTLRGDNLFVNGDLSLGNNTNFSSFTYNSDDGGYLSITTNNNSLLKNDFFIPVDVEKKYEYGVTVKTSNSSTRVYMGFIPFDIDRNVINSSMILYRPNTLTTLAKDLNNGDQYIYLTDMTNWNVNASVSFQRGFIFWNYVDSTGYHYPELTYSRNIWKDLYNNNTEEITDNIQRNVEIDGEIVNRIKLKSVWNKNYIPAGTKLSQSSEGNSYSYALKSSGNLSLEWTNRNTLFQDIQQSYVYEDNKFKYGQRYFKFMVMPNYSALPDVTTYYKDFYLREITN